MTRRLGPTWCKGPGPRGKPDPLWHLVNAPCAPKQPTAYHSTVPVFPLPPSGEVCLACQVAATEPMR